MRACVSKGKFPFDVILWTIKSLNWIELNWVEVHDKELHTWWSHLPPLTRHTIGWSIDPESLKASTSQWVGYLCGLICCAVATTLHFRLKHPALELATSHRMEHFVYKYVLHCRAWMRCCFVWISTLTAIHISNLRLYIKMPPLILYRLFKLDPVRV